MKKMVSMRLPEHLIWDLEENAKKLGISKSEYLIQSYWIAQEVLNTTEGRKNYEWIFKTL